MIQEAKENENLKVRLQNLVEENALLIEQVVMLQNELKKGYTAFQNTISHSKNKTYFKQFAFSLVTIRRSIDNDKTIVRLRFLGISIFKKIIYTTKKEYYFCSLRVYTKKR